MRTLMGRLGIAATAAAVSLTIFSAVPAGAAGGQSLGGAGSDTTYWMMKAISTSYNANPGANQGDVATMIPPLNTPPFPASVTVPGDATAPAKTWDSSNAAATPPNGSSAGISALNADTTGQIDFARSSRGPNAGETGSLQFWAYGLGAVDPVRWKNTYQPAGLTRNDLIRIYTCNTSGPHKGQPIVANWHYLNKKLPLKGKYQIIRYAPQAGSGTLSFFQTKLLGGHTVDQNCNASHKAIRLEEHDARGVAQKVKPNAIFMYDWARWKAQANGFEADLRNGSTLAKWGVTASTEKFPSNSTVNESATRFNGSRYVYNVNRLVNHPASDTTQLDSVLQFVGVRPTGSGGAGYICSGGLAAQISQAGFVPLPVAATGGSGLPNSACRLNPTPL